MDSSRSIRGALLAGLVAAVSFISTPAIQAEDAAEALDIKYVPEEAVAAVIVRPRSLLTQPGAEMMPLEVITAAGIQELGIDPLDVDSVMLLVGPPSPAGPPELGVVIRLTKDYEKGEIVAKLLRNIKRKGFSTGSMPDRRTILLAQPGLGEAMQEADGTSDSPLLQLLRESTSSSHVQLVFAMEPVREFSKQAMAGMPPLPPPLQGIKKVPDQLQSLKLDVNLGRDVGARLLLTASDDQAAEDLEALLNMGLAICKQQMLAKVSEARPMDSSDQVPEAIYQYTRRMTDTLFEMLVPKRQGNQLSVQAEVDSGVLTMGMMVAGLMPVASAARESARLMASKNQLRQLGMAMMQAEAANGQFPAAAITSDDGKPLLSWRVSILPYLGEKDLYEQFHLDEPWDSEHNKALLSKMPAIFANPRSDEVTKTNYLLVTGEGTLFSEAAPASASATDGASNTIMMIEAATPVEWTRPVDWVFDPQRPARGLGDTGRDAFVAYFVDGHVDEVERFRGDEVLKALFTHRGGEINTGSGVVSGDEDDEDIDLFSDEE